MTTDHVIAHIRLPRALRAHLKVLAARRETSLRQLAIEAFEAILATEGVAPHTAPMERPAPRRQGSA